MNILVLGGHLDDGLYAVGGLIAKAVRAGAQVDVVCFGHSDEDYDDVARTDGASDRALAAAREAHALLGVRTFTCHRYPDFAVQENR